MFHYIQAKGSVCTSATFPFTGATAAPSWASTANVQPALPYDWTNMFAADETKETLGKIISYIEQEGRPGFVIDDDDFIEAFAEKNQPSSCGRSAYH